MNSLSEDLLKLVVSYCDTKTIVNLAVTSRDNCDKLWDLVGKDLDVACDLLYNNGCNECNYMRITDVCDVCYKEYRDSILEMNRLIAEKDSYDCMISDLCDEYNTRERLDEEY